MKKMRKFVKTLFIAIVALVCALALFACGFSDVTDPTEPQPSLPPSSQTAAELKELDLTELLAKAYNKTAPNFTLELTSESEGKTECATIIYDAKVGYKIIAGGSESVYSDGLLYIKTGGGNEESGNASEGIWQAFESDAFVALNAVKERNLEAAFDLILPYLGIDVDKKADTDGDKYVVQTQSSRAEELNALLKIAKENIDEKAIVGVTKAVNYLNDSSLSQEEFEALFVLYGDSTFEELLKQGKPINGELLSASYEMIRLLLEGGIDLPSFSELSDALGGLTLSGLFGRGSAEETIALWKEQTLRERLENYPYTDGTLADFVASDAPTVFTKADASFKLYADSSFTFTEFIYTSYISARDVPVFTESLVSGGLKTTLKDAEFETKVRGKFLSVGSSRVDVPENYVVVGREHLTVDSAGKYAVKRGTANRPTQKTGIVAVGAGADFDGSQWVSLLKKIAGGITLDNENGLLCVSAAGYESMKLAMSEGLTELRVTTYEEFEFVVNVK